ncbi:MAG TPA: cell division protein FtsA [Spirochaetota bacterium]|nr:cell division protein FtsA [Spirochaetota bacterium]
MRYKDEDLITAIDIGSDKVVVAISEIDDTGSINVIGIGKSGSKNGIKQGVIVNIESVVSALTEAVEQAEIQAGREISSVYVGISSANIETINSKGIVAISGVDKEIRENDINRVIEAGKAVAIPMDREILHIIPQAFTVDGQRGIKYPIGMVGTRLECQIHILTCAISSIQNVMKSMDRAGLIVRNLVLQNLAAAKSLLTEDEKELGVLLIDIGAETAKVSVYHEQAPYYNAIFLLGGYLITGDLSQALKISYANAEKIKEAYGVADFEYVEDDETIQIPSIGGREPKYLARKNLVHIIRPRVEEIFSIIKNDLIEKGYFDKISGGIVLTGGSTIMPGMAEVCQEVFDLQARVGGLRRFAGLGDEISGPEYSVINGLLLWGIEDFNKNNDFLGKPKREESGKNVFQKIKDMFGELF